MDRVTAALPFQAAYAPADEELAAKFLTDVPRARIDPAIRGAIARHIRQKFGRQFFVRWCVCRLERQSSRHSVHAGILSRPR